MVVLKKNGREDRHALNKHNEGKYDDVDTPNALMHTAMWNQAPLLMREGTPRGGTLV